METSRCEFFNGKKVCGKRFKSTYKTFCCPECSVILDQYQRQHNLGTYKFMGEVPYWVRPTR